MKISIFGMGRVGSSIAAALVSEQLCKTLVLVDLNRDLARAEAMDLHHAACVGGSPMRILGGDVTDSADSDIVIVTASVSLPPGVTDRNHYATGNGALMRKLLPEIARRSPSAILLMLSNPMDVLTSYALEVTGFPWERVIGSGTLLDTARWRAAISGYTGVHSNDIRAYILGEHGPHMVPLVSSVNLAGELADDVGYQRELARRAMEEGVEVFRIRGYTNHAIARAAAMIVGAIVHDSRQTMPVSVWSDGYAGIDGVCLSLPCVIGRSGVQRILHPALSDDEREQLRSSAESIRTTLALCRGA
ncbi:malate dehydrogenase [Propionivibrio dicarboxylicus]|uniref:L-lactate dehydrogenase n=1 Tax=Propionivibrio dicarboxylicus TaxID=83767 RepID=A0A1G8G4X1_9RHOO|nr:hypothetical protein [Propionivibrio dicarboxylicus]SDH89395.1 L-lactate dehydrogenase [Propionivibrio dicarboxylicus]